MATTLPRLLILLVLAAAAAGCASSTSAGDRTTGSAWTPLFNGHDLTGWTPKIVGHPAGADPHGVFRVEGGALVARPAPGVPFDGAFGHLFHERELSHYRLRLEVRFFGEQAAGGPGWAWRNSGVMVHGQTPDSMGRDQEFPVSIEVQLLGGGPEGERPTGNLCTPGTHVEIDGALVTQHCLDSTSATQRGDDWVRVEIEVRGARLVRHLVEGVEVLRYAAPQLDPDDPDAAALAAARGTLVLDRGTISLQAESHPVAFRNIELLELDSDAALSPAPPPGAR